jgi:hypothetical protein
MAEPEALIQSSGTWKTQALSRCRCLGLDYRKMLAWYDTVMSRVDSAWFKDQCRKATVPTRTLADAHPLYRLLTEGTDTALIQVCELGQYMGAFSSDPSIPDVSRDLVSAKFPSTLFELAMAHRWQSAGAQVVLQAPATGGRLSDFSAVINGLTFVVEASNISTALFDQLSFRTPLLIREAARPALGEGSALIVKLTVRTPPSKDWEQAVRRSVKECCRELNTLTSPREPTRVSRDTGDYVIEVERQPAPERGDPIALSCLGPELDHRHVSNWDVQFDLVTETEPRQLQLRTLIRFPVEGADSASRILKKLDREAEQLHGVRGPRVVLLDISGVEPNALQLNTEPLRQGLEHELRGTPELACVWLVSRGWTTEMRYQYRVQFVPNSESPFQLPRSFLGTFLRNEWLWDFLGDREIIHGTEEDAIRSFLGRQPRLWA